MPDAWNHLGVSHVPDLSGWWILCTARPAGGWTVDLYHEVGMEDRALHATADLPVDEGFAAYHVVARLVARVHGHKVAAAYLESLADYFAAEALAGLVLLAGPVNVPHHPHHPAR